MSNIKNFIVTKEYKRFAEFCDACIKYKYIGICYGLPGVGKTLSARKYANWNYVQKQTSYTKAKEIGIDSDEKILECNTLFYTAPAIRANKMIDAITALGTQIEYG